MAKFQSRDATHSPKCGCSALTCPHRAHKKANARAIVTELFSLSDYTHTVCEKGKMTICIQVWDVLWCLLAFMERQMRQKSVHFVNWIISQSPGSRRDLWDQSTIPRTHTCILESVPEIDLGNDIENASRIVLPNDLENVPGIILWNNLNWGRIKLQERFLTCSNLALDVCSHSDFQTCRLKLTSSDFLRLHWTLQKEYCKQW